MLAWIERNLTWILIGLGTVLFVGAVLQVIWSLPPRDFTFVTGREGGAYYASAQAYQRIGKEKGFDIEILPSAGSLEALRLLQEGKGDVAFIQGGIAAQGDPTIVSSLATVGYEPVWIFYRKELAPEEPLDSLLSLQGRTIAIGEAGSGTNQLARQLLAEVNLGDANTELLELSTTDTIEAFKKGDLDAAIVVANNASPSLQELLQNPALELLSLRHADALAKRQRFLRVLTLPEGTLDLVNIAPRADVKLLATEANLVVRNDLHPDLLRLLTIAAVRVHGPAGFFNETGEFPSTQNVDLPISMEALAYLARVKSGDSTLDRYLPFWAAAIVDRYLLFIVPIALIVLPLLGRSPLLYQAYMRNKVNRWYKTVHKIELRVDTMQLPEIEATIAELEDLDAKLAHELTVSNSYLPNVYDLRTHIQHVIGQVEKRRARLVAQTAAVA